MHTYTIVADGTARDLEAWWLDVRGGLLTGYDEQAQVLFSFAPGSWASCSLRKAA